MIQKVGNTHVALTVIYDPVDMFKAGDQYLRGDIAEWLENDDLPIGMILRNGRDWTVADDGTRLVLRDAQGNTLDAEGVRSLHRQRRRRAVKRIRVMRALRDLTAELGQPPAYHEIATRLDVGTSLVKYHLDVLQAEGYVDKQPFKHRTLTLTEAGIAAIREGEE